MKKWKKKALNLGIQALKCSYIGGKTNNSYMISDTCQPINPYYIHGACCMTQKYLTDSLNEPKKKTNYYKIDTLIADKGFYKL